MTSLYFEEGRLVFFFKITELVGHALYIVRYFLKRVDLRVQKKKTCTFRNLRAISGR